MEEKRVFSPEDFRDVLEKLFPYIPYFEERVNGTFKFRYYDTPETRKMDPEAYDRSQTELMQILKKSRLVLDFAKSQFIL